MSNYLKKGECFMKKTYTSICLFCLFLLFSITTSFAQSKKYVGIHYLGWWTNDAQWNSAWGTNPNIIHFETGTLAGFSTTGSAFGTTACSIAHGSVSGWEGSYWADSYNGGETATGTLTSSNFIPNNTFRFKVAGYDGQNGTSNQNYYYLRRASDNVILFSAKPPQSDTFTWIEWNTAAYNNTSCYFQVVDGNSATGYAWLAVDGSAPIIPTKGIYVSSDQSVAAIDAQTFKEMAIDFAFVDNTNNTIWGPGHPTIPVDYIWNNNKTIANGFAQVSGGIKTASILSVTSWDSDVTKVQRLFKNYAVGYPWIPTNSGDLFVQKVSMVYNELANDPSKYFYLEGKPLLGLYVSLTGTVFDENNIDQTPDGTLGISWNPLIPNTGGKTIRELFTIRWVGAFQNNNNSKFTQTTGDLLKCPRGHWSWEDGTPQTWASRSNGWGDTPDGITCGAYARTPIQGRNNGITFKNMWLRAFDVDPVISIIHTWNEFSSGDETSPEYSQSIEPTTFYFGSTYKTMAQNYITHFKRYRMDIGFYDNVAKKVYFKNRTNDFDGYSFSFSFETSYNMDRGGSVEVLSGDFNGDGKTDFALRNISDGTIAIRYSPYFTVESSGGQPAEKVVSLESGSRYQAFVGDFNHDGKADIGFYDATGGAGGPGFIIRYNDGNSNFGTVYTWPWTLSGTYQFMSADINGDGYWDIVYRNPASGVATFALSKTDGLQSKPSSIYSYGWVAGTNYQLLTGNVDGNPYHDFGLRDNSTGKFYMLQNANSKSGSTWNFNNQQTFTWISGSQYFPITGDFR